MVVVGFPTCFCGSSLWHRILIVSVRISEFSATSSLLEFGRNIWLNAFFEEELFTVLYACTDRETRV